MKGILLAGGSGTRLYPLTQAISKQLVPVYDKPLIYYPLSVLMLAGLTEILIISTARDIPLIQALLGDGSQLGIKLQYQIQESPNGIPEAFILAEEFLAGDSCCLILGDNIFYGPGFQVILDAAKSHCENKRGASIFSYYVKDPERYGIIELDQQGAVLSLEEKPDKPQSNYAVTGLYFYDEQVVELAKTLKLSDRSELEIMDLNRLYLEKNALKVQILGRGFAWLDAGTHDSLLDASQYISTIENRQGLKIGCLEEIAWRKGFINQQILKEHAKKLAKTDYGRYLQRLVDES